MREKLLLDLAEALAHRHSEQVVHNDVKPGNVLVFCQEKWRAKLADFGNAQVYMTLPALTLNYRSPEVILGKRPGPPSDMWSLGVLLYEMMWRAIVRSYFGIRSLCVHV